MNNLLAWCLQVAAAVIAAAAIRPIIGIRVPAAKLIYWQSILAACLLLPFLRPWKEAAVQAAVTVTTTIIGTTAAPRPASWHVPWSVVGLTVLCAGILIRLVGLATGFYKLRRLRIGSIPFDGMPDVRISDVRISKDVTSPVTFGFLRPVILLPADFPALDAPVREAILCHERLHIERRDWLFMVAEELIRALLWFHPAIWYLLSEVQLAREQAVDEDVIRRTSLRDRYVDALLKVSGAGYADLAPAPLFLRRRHLKQRLVNILKEVRMSKMRSLSTLTAGLALMAGLCWFISGAIPLVAQTPADAPGVSVDAGGAELMHRAAVGYPPAALAGHVEGTVVVQATLGPTGTVREATAISGPEELRSTVLQSVRQWHYVREAAPIQQISITFHVPGDENVTVKDVQITGLSEKATTQLRSQLPVHEGDAVTPERIRQVGEAAAAFDEHLTATTKRTSETSATVVVAPSNAPNLLRVGGNVAQANLLTKVTPLYPPDAKAARIQGLVKLEVQISPEGQVENVRVMSGPPMLIPAAVGAVSQWTYKPTLLNGQPVGIMTTVDVNFTLSQ